VAVERVAHTLAHAGAAVILAAGSFRLTEVVASQNAALWLGFIPRWNVIPQFLGFVVFFVAAFAETNRTPFDLPEADAELVAGYHTEYSSMKFAMFFMAEYINVIVASAMTTTLFFGGWGFPGFHPHGVMGGLLSIAIFSAKTLFFVWVFVWVRWTLPRFRYDQLMKLGWKVLLPTALVNLFWTAALIAGGRL
jgi:NADH-quinone oxidoreductase subunit H